MTQNVVLAVYTSAAASTPVYLAMTGAAARSVIASRTAPDQLPAERPD